MADRGEELPAGAFLAGAFGGCRRKSLGHLVHPGSQGPDLVSAGDATSNREVACCDPLGSRRKALQVLGPWPGDGNAEPDAARTPTPRTTMTSVRSCADRNINDAATATAPAPAAIPSAVTDSNMTVSRTDRVRRAQIGRVHTAAAAAATIHRG